MINGKNYLFTGILLGSLLTLCFQIQINAQAIQPVNSTEAAKWREDLRFMAQEMPKHHKNLFHQMTREQFDGAIKKLDERIPQLASHQIIVGMMKIVAMAGEEDGHTAIAPLFDTKINFRSYPIQLYQFKDGLYIQAADKQYQDAVGSRVVRIGNANVEQAFKAVSEVVSRDNEMTLKNRVPQHMVIPEILYAVGVINDMENAQFVVEKNGQQTVLNLKPAQLKKKTHGANDNKIPENWIDARDANSLVPLWLKSPGTGYWFEYLENSRTVYVQYNQVMNQQGESILAFFKRVFDFVEAHDVDRFVLDVRLNGGGDQKLNMPILLGVIKSNKINQRGHFFVITGRGTYSATQVFVNELERYTNAVFVGEPTGGSPHFYADSDRFFLPNSGIAVLTAALWWQNMDPRDSRQWIAPSLNTELTFADYKNNIDPAMNVILNYASQKSLTELLTEALSANDVALAKKRYAEFKANPLYIYANTESEINSLGYQLMSMNQVEKAVEIFKLNTESYPNSSNAYDSLADAYAKTGNKEFAVKNYRKALEINPKNDVTAHKLKELTSN